MIRCPVCQHEEYVGAVHCSECGSRLTTLEERYRPPERAAETQSTATPSPKARQVTLELVDHERQLPLADGDEFTLGRVSGNQPILPDIDLTAFQAYECGVSRLHATIRVTRDKVTILDLGSSNGTRVNSEQISSHQPHYLHDGDLIALGKFKIRIRLQT